MMSPPKRLSRLENVELQRRGTSVADDRRRNILRQLAQLERLDIVALKERWRALFGTEPPGYNRVFLTKRLAYRIQELAYGGLSESSRETMSRMLDEQGYDEIGRARAAGRKGTPAAADRITQGTALIREWDGERHEVTVLADGFEYRGRRFRSLSAIARSITGTRWNGPRFFGLRGGETKRTGRASDGQA